MSEPYAWESTTLGYTRWITDSRYRRLRPSYRRWYRPLCERCTRAPSDHLNIERSGE
jgi:hypothetical protein